MALAAGTGYLVKLIYYVSIDTLKMVVQIPVPNLMALTSLMGRTQLKSNLDPIFLRKKSGQKDGFKVR